MTDPGLSQALAKVVDRLMDRFIPKPVSPRDRGEEIARWLGAFIGGVFWEAALLGYLISIEFVNSKNILIYIFSCSMICLLFTWLIVRSFDRGRPLTYFFLGLTVPVLSSRMLRLGFPF